MLRAWTAARPASAASAVLAVGSVRLVRVRLPGLELPSWQALSLGPAKAQLREWLSELRGLLASVQVVQAGRALERR